LPRGQCNSVGTKEWVISGGAIVALLVVGFLAIYKPGVLEYICSWPLERAEGRACLGWVPYVITCIWSLISMLAIFLPYFRNAINNHPEANSGLARAATYPRIIGAVSLGVWLLWAHAHRYIVYPLSLSIFALIVTIQVIRQLCNLDVINRQRMARYLTMTSAVKDRPRTLLFILFFLGTYVGWVILKRISIVGAVALLTGSFQVGSMALLALPVLYFERHPRRVLDWWQLTQGESSILLESKPAEPGTPSRKRTLSWVRTIWTLFLIWSLGWASVLVIVSDSNINRPGEKVPDAGPMISYAVFFGLFFAVALAMLMAKEWPTLLKVLAAEDERGFASVESKDRRADTGWQHRAGEFRAGDGNAPY
jgi:hypothetical protein